jgi:RNA 2',3'-cyclic 3'-phosphodiesterase
MENNIVRSFFAIPFSKNCLKYLSEIILQLKKEMPSVIRWVDINNVHLTLKFLGEFNSSDIAPIKKRLEIAFSGISQFNFKLFNLAFFPNERKPKIIWVGVSLPDQLKQLIAIIEETAFSLGYSKERRDFTPHVTIGRVKENSDPSDLLQIGRIVGNKKECEICISEVKEIVFIRSDLTPTGPVYSDLFSIKFKE